MPVVFQLMHHFVFAKSTTRSMRVKQNPTNDSDSNILGINLQSGDFDNIYLFSFHKV